MNSSLLMNFSVDKENKKIKVERSFAAPVAKVWAAWTQSELLDQWWAPKPWKAHTKSLDFKEGGYWLYAMKGPDGTEHWAKSEFKSIETEKNFSTKDSFCDPEGNINESFPGSFWSNTFKQTGDNTTVNVEITYNELTDLEATLSMGFKEGFTAALGNLDEIFG
jgi:uncharacterized protein YndB with AHSA1/START domain